MAIFRNRSGKWQARVQIKGQATITKPLLIKPMPSVGQGKLK